uniref:Uncharacterized protein n=1 Tax=Anguilla anguilla TaxID=7936 RepID=A0A0E9UDH8_ANGAN
MVPLERFELKTFWFPSFLTNMTCWCLTLSSLGLGRAVQVGPLLYTAAE